MTDQRPLTEAEALALLRERCAKWGGQRAIAAAAGVTPAFICDVLGGRKKLSPAVAKGIGLAHADVYYVVQEVEQADAA